MRIDKAYTDKLLLKVEPDASLVKLNEFNIGVNVEMEHRETIIHLTHQMAASELVAAAGAIALDHLKEDSMYYTKLRNAGL